MNKHLARALVPGTAFTQTATQDVPAGGTGTAAGGWDTAGNRDAAITRINQMRADLTGLITELKNQGILS